MCVVAAEHGLVVDPGVLLDRAQLRLELVDARRERRLTFGERRVEEGRAEILAVTRRPPRK